MTDKKEKKLNSETIYEGKIFTVTRDEVELSNGLLRKREIVHHSGGVVILAEKGSKILLVEQYRYATGETLYELPAGKLDKPDEDILSAAKRELEEETGHIANNWESLGFIWPTPGFCTEKLHLFFATDLTYTKPQPEEGEILDFFEIEKEEVFKMIKNHKINDAKSICAIMRAYKL